MNVFLKKRSKVLFGREFVRHFSTNMVSSAETFDLQVSDMGIRYFIRYSMTFSVECSGAKYDDAAWIVMQGCYPGHMNGQNFVGRFSLVEKLVARYLTFKPGTLRPQKGLYLLA